jgi:ABC-type polysaccharide/polyol phosphate export permease
VQTFTDLYRYRFVLSNLVSKNVKVMYRNMALGFLWSLLQPVVLVVTLSLVWHFFMGDDGSFAAKVVVVLIPYNFFAYCLGGCVISINGNVHLVKKIAFPRQILPISAILTHLIHFGVQSILIVLVLAIFPHGGQTLSLNLFWLLPIFIIQLGLVTGLGFLVAGLNVLYRDVQYIAESALLVLFWICPILYEASGSAGGVTSKLAESPWLYHTYFLNPMSGILEAYRSVLYYGRSPDLTTLGMALIVTLIIGYFGMKSFWKHEKEFADLV